MRSFLKSRGGRAAAVVAALLVLYTLAGFLLVPRIVRSLIVDNVHESLGLTAAVGAVEFNPLRLHLEIHDFSLPGADGAKLVGFRRLAVSVGASSLWRRALVLTDIEIEAPAEIDHAHRPRLDPPIRCRVRGCEQDAEANIDRCRGHEFANTPIEGG